MKSENLKTILDSLYASRSQAHLANDPLAFCHRYTDPADQEVAALIAAAFAYGKVKSIQSSLERIFSLIGPKPRRFVENFEPKAGLARFAGFKHRFNDHRDLCALLLAIRTMLEEADSIEDYFLGFHDPVAEDVTQALVEFTASILAMDYSTVFNTEGIPQDSYFSFFFPSPASGSACKRLCMFLRWMVRPADGIDLGLWKGVSPARLIIPVDAHIQRIGKLLGLTGRRQADWRMAREITAALRGIDPLDPIKYDFSLCHLGISEGCTGKDQLRCRNCPIVTICATGCQ